MHVSSKQLLDAISQESARVRREAEVDRVLADPGPPGLMGIDSEGNTRLVQGRLEYRTPTGVPRMPLYAVWSTQAE